MTTEIDPSEIDLHLENSTASHSNHEDVESSSDEDESTQLQSQLSSNTASSTATPAAQPVDISLIGVWKNTQANLQCNPSFYTSYGGGSIACAALFVGCVFGIGTQWILFGLMNASASQTALLQLGLYLFMMATFHLLEFVWTAIFHPKKLSASSFLLNHSREYHIALILSLIEYVIEWYFFPSLKYPSCSLLMWFGFVIVLGGQLFRTLAMFTAASNFTHQVADQKEPNHELVTHGIYSLCRHPSYAGWFWWSVGTQVLLCNPICFVAYAATSFLFFRGRINYEERLMLHFFGDAYVQYQKRVPSGVPFIKGYQL